MEWAFESLTAATHTIIYTISLIMLMHMIMSGSCQTQQDLPTLIKPNTQI